MAPDPLHALVELRIREAQERGDFDNNPYDGKTLPDDPLMGAPVHVRVGARVHQAVGLVPEEVTLSREIASLQAKVKAGNATPTERDRLRKATLRRAVLHEAAGRHLLAGYKTFLPG